VLARAIFVMTGTREFAESEAEAEYEKWIPILERSLLDPLGKLIDTYGKSVRKNTNATISNLDELLNDLRKASELRNVLCHGSWPPPDVNGASCPKFFKPNGLKFDTLINVDTLEQVQTHTAQLICTVINSITHMGYQFPGSTGPGKDIWPRQ
jgi:hypothetical protein